MSLNIYCLAASCPTVVMYTVSKYYRYFAIAWVAPLPLPLIALTLTNTDTDDIGYDLTWCWLAISRSILFFFAGPVLTVVTINLTMFIGIVWCLGSLMENATNAVRKEENKRQIGIMDGIVLVVWNHTQFLGLRLTLVCVCSGKKCNTGCSHLSSICNPWEGTTT